MRSNVWLVPCVVTLETLSKIEFRGRCTGGFSASTLPPPLADFILSLRGRLDKKAMGPVQSHPLSFLLERGLYAISLSPILPATKMGHFLSAYYFSL